MEMRQFWDLDFPDKVCVFLMRKSFLKFIKFADIYSKMVVDPRSEDEIVEGVRSRLLESVRLRMRADVPVGVYLSGGLDSSAIAGMMCHLKKNVPKSTVNPSEDNSLLCFTIAFDEDSGMDESGNSYSSLQHKQF
jgi:asparagine synthase (glutamine-hydrolysing)